MLTSCEVLSLNKIWWEKRKKGGSESTVLISFLPAWKLLRLITNRGSRVFQSVQQVPYKNHNTFIRIPAPKFDLMSRVCYKAFLV